jgi:hypothetical protein
VSFGIECWILGHVVFSNGIEVDLKKVEAGKQWPRPTIVSKIRRRIALIIK